MQKHKYFKEAHFGDSCIYLSIVFNDQDRKLCEKYFTQVNAGVYRLITSQLVVGEVLSVILYSKKRKLEKANLTREQAIKKATDLLSLAELYVPRSYNSYIDAVKKIKFLTDWFYITDVRLLALAIESPYNIFLTTREKKMKEHRKLNKLIKIKRVEDLFR